MTPVARFTPQAGRDIDAIVEGIASDNIDAALRFYESVRTDANDLARMPGMGPLYGLRGPFANVHFWPITRFRSYLLFYRPIPEGIEIVRILHGARDIPRTIHEE
jgi:toxin ParE1/3/4